MTSFPIWLIWAGSFALAAVMVYGILRVRQRTWTEKARGEAATARLYDEKASAEDEAKTAPLAGKIVPPD